MSHIKVGVLRGGKSDEYDLSMKMGARILDVLKKEPLNKEFRPVDILIDKSGVWHIGGLPMLPEQAIRQVDVIFNSLHGAYGGDGRIQHILETFNIPFTGSKAFGTIMARDKKATRNTLKKEGIKTPYAKDLHLEHGDELDDVAKNLFHTFPMPVVVKPRNTNESVGVSIARNFDELLEAIDRARVFSNDIVVEEYITGKEIISGFIDDFRGQSHYPLMPVHVEPHSPILEFADKLAGSYSHRVPALLTGDEKLVIENIVRRTKESLGLRHIGTVDVIISPRRGAYVLDVNTHPHFHEHAPFLKSLYAVGSSEDELIAHLIRLALKG